MELEGVACRISCRLFPTLEYPDSRLPIHCTTILNNGSCQYRDAILHDLGMFGEEG